MSPARIKKRRLSTPCPVCKKTVHHQVIFRLGGRGYPELVAGTFHHEKYARLRRDFVAGEIAAGRDPRVALRQLAAQQAPAPPATVRERGQAYLRSRLDYDEETTKNTRSHLRRINDRFGDRDQATITVGDIQEWVADQTTDRPDFPALKPSSVSRYFSTLAQLLDFCGVDPNPARDKRVKLPTVEYEEPQPPPADHVIAILDFSPRRWRLPFVVLEQTAMNVGELETLEWRDVDVAGNRFRLRRAEVKGQIRARARWVQVPDWLMTIIATTCPPEDRVPERRVFIGFTPDAAKNVVARACKAARIPHYHPRDFRHRRLSLWHGQGIPAKELAERAGHSRASMTLDVYSHVMPLDEVSQETLRELIEASR